MVKVPQLTPPQIALTVIDVFAVVVHPPLVTKYEIVKVPTPAVAGLNVPAAALVMPVPDQVPPATEALRFRAGLAVQKGPTGVIVTMGAALTWMLAVLVSLQPPIVTVYVIVNVPAPAVAGSKVPAAAFVIPVPLQLPPAVAAVRFTAASLVQ